MAWRHGLRRCKKRFNKDLEEIKKDAGTGRTRVRAARPPPRGPHPVHTGVGLPRPAGGAGASPRTPVNGHPYEKPVSRPKSTQRHTWYIQPPWWETTDRVHLKADGFVYSHTHKNIFWPFKANKKGTTHHYC